MITLKSAGIGAGLVTGGAGLTAIVGYSNGLFNSEPHTEITKLLKSENKYALLSQESNQDNDGWLAAWKEYQKDNKNSKAGQDKWQVVGFKKEDAPTTVPAAFKSKCSEKQTTKVENTQDRNYIDFTKYCARAKTMEEILKEGEFKSLKDDETNARWKAKIVKYKIATDQLPKVVLSAEAREEKFVDLQKGCEDALKLKTTDPDYEKTIEPAKKWCGE